MNTRIQLAVLVVIVCSGISVAQEKARTDVHGEPLPAKAIARLGPSRLHNAGRVNALTFSADGNWLAASGKQGGIRVWDAADGKSILAAGANAGPVTALVFLSRANEAPTLLISGGADKCVRFWHLPSGKPDKLV